MTEDGEAGSAGPGPEGGNKGRSQLVIQGSHMVSGTRCPAWSNQLKRWSGSRAAALKGRCPVGHREES